MVPLWRSLFFNRSVHRIGHILNPSVVRVTFPIRLINSAQNHIEPNISSLLYSIEEKARYSGKICPRDVEHVLTHVKNGQSLGSSDAAKILKCFGSSMFDELPHNRVQLLENTWQLFENLAVELDIGAYNAKLKMYCENEHIYSPSEFLADLKEKGIEPDLCTFQHIIDHYSQIGHVNEIIRSLDYMKATGIRPLRRDYGSLILGYSNAGLTSECRNVVELMRQAGGRPNKKIHMCILRAYAKQGNIDIILSDLRNERYKKFGIDPVEYVEIVYDLAVNDYTDQMEQILAIMPTAHNSSFRNACANACIRLLNRGKDDAAWEILKKRPMEEVHGKVVDSGTYYIEHLVTLNRPINTIIAVCEDLHRESLHSNGLKSLIAKLTEVGSVDAAVDVFRYIQFRGWPLLMESDFQRVFLGKIQPAQILKLLKIMLCEFGIPLSCDTARHIVVPQLNIDTPECTVRDLLEAKVSFTVATTSVVFQCLKENRIKDAAETVSKFNATINPTVICDELINAVNKTRDYESFINILKPMYENFEIIADSKNDTLSKLHRRTDMMGQILHKTVMAFEPAERFSVLKKIACLFVNERFEISIDEASKLNEIFKCERADEVKVILQELSSYDENNIQSNKIRPPNKWASHSIGAEKCFQNNER